MPGRRLVALFSAAAAATSLTTPSSADAGWDDRCANADAPPGKGRSAERAVGCLLNAVRREHGRQPLRPDGSLALAAERHAADQVRRGYFSHVTPAGAGLRDRVRRTRYLDSARRWWLGETLAWGTGRRATPVGVVRAWLASPTHRRVLLRQRAQDVGVGIRRGAPTGARGDAGTIVADFGAR
jgi:uncharacterized protein YkwD